MSLTQAPDHGWKLRNSHRIRDKRIYPDTAGYIESNRGDFGSQYNVQPFVGISVEAAVESVEGESREMEGKKKSE